VQRADAAPAPAPTAASAYHDLEVAAKGDENGLVEADEIFRLIGRLNTAELKRAAQDHTLFVELSAKFAAVSMTQLCMALPLTLFQKIFWCDKSTELGAIADEVVFAWVALAPRTEIIELLGHAELMQKVEQHLPLPPSRVLAVSFPGLAVLDLYAESLTATRWLGRSKPEIVIQQIAPPGAPAAKILQAKHHLVQANLWAGVKAGLPHGAALDAATRAALMHLVTVDHTEAPSLFPIRFDKPLTGTWNPLDVLGVWKQLDHLPDQDVSQNTVLAAFKAIEGDAGFWTSPNVELGSGLRESKDFGPTRLPHTVRHEIGHAVHDMLGGVVDSWLQNGVQFWYYGGGLPGIDQVVADFGGWPTKYRNSSDVEQPFGVAERQQVEAMLAAHINTQKWTSKTDLPKPPVRRPGVAGPPTAAETIRELWDAMPAALRQCFAGSASYWYENYLTHPRGAAGFTFWNHWYAKPYHFGPIAKAAITATGDTYSAMSELEFFANCYAEYFGDPAGMADHTKWGGSLSADVKSFFREHIDLRHPYQYAAGAGAGSSLPPSPRSVKHP
jgi:hypothetical protein